MIKHPKLQKWESRLKSLLNSLDDELENHFGKTLQLHPARSARGTTSSKDQDGLFDITAAFSLGLGSKTGKGYVIDIHLATLENIPGQLKKEIEDYALKALRKQLPAVFPGENLKIQKEANIIKLFGDLSL